MEINYREFIRRFGRYKGVDKVIVVGRNGPIGVWYGNVREDILSDNYEEKEEDLSDNGGNFVKNAAYEKFGGLIESDNDLSDNLSDKDEEMSDNGFGNEEVKCEKCGRAGEGRCSWWDEVEGDEREGIFCGRCAKGAGIKLIYF